MRLGLIAWKPHEMLKLDRTIWHCAHSTHGSQKGVGTTRQLHALSRKDATADHVPATSELSAAFCGAISYIGQLSRYHTFTYHVG